MLPYRLVFDTFFMTHFFFYSRVQCGCKYTKTNIKIYLQKINNKMKQKSAKKKQKQKSANLHVLGAMSYQLYQENKVWIALLFYTCMQPNTKLNVQCCLTHYVITLNMFYRFSLYSIKYDEYVRTCTDLLLFYYLTSFWFPGLHWMPLHSSEEVIWNSKD